MVGLRTHENDKFLKFWKIVQDEAQKRDKTFFLDCGNGHSFEDDAIECEDLSGWLVDNDKADKFNKLFTSHTPIGDEWADNIVFVKWQKNRDAFSVKFV